MFIGGFLRGEEPLWQPSARHTRGYHNQVALPLGASQLLLNPEHRVAFTFHHRLVVDARLMAASAR